MTEDINANVTPPGSSESFNQFTNRVIGTIKGIASDNDGHNTVVVTHSKPIKAFTGWEHAGYPDDTSDISMSAYHDTEQKPGKHEEVTIPYQVAADLKKQQPWESAGGAPTSSIIRGPGVPEVKSLSEIMKGNTNARIDLEPMHKDIRDAVEAGKSVSEIAKDLNLSEFLVKGRMKEMGLESKQKIKEWPQEHLDTLQDMLKEGKSYSDIAEQLGRSRSSVAGKVNRLK
jgi:GcrA cell cycle regulator/Histidine phosphatase superfamily (branch 1)